MISLSYEQLERLEMRLLLDGIFRRYGYDFRQYARPALTRRVRRAVREEGTGTILGLLEKILHGPDGMELVFPAFSVSATSFFRDPEFFRQLRGAVLPRLAHLPLLRIWVAGCSTGEEAYSLAILLDEADLLSRARIYATDMSQCAIARAAAGIFPRERVTAAEEAYRLSGGQQALASHFSMHPQTAVAPEALRKNIMFARHNLVSDGSFNDFHLVLCRNVLIYFNRLLQARVHTLLYDSLIPGGFFGLGAKESLRFTPHEPQYTSVSVSQKIYRKGV